MSSWLHELAVAAVHPAPVQPAGRVFQERNGSWPQSHRALQICNSGQPLFDSACTVQVIVVDAISSLDDVRALRSIIHRGISVVACAEATSLAKLLSNSELDALVRTHAR